MKNKRSNSYFLRTFSRFGNPVLLKNEYGQKSSCMKFFHSMTITVPTQNSHIFVRPIWVTVTF